MMFRALVEVDSVFASPFGGAVFKGVVLGEKNKISFRASYKVLIEIPKSGEYWQVEGYEVFSKEYGRTVNVSSAFIKPIPSSKVIGRLLSKHPAFRGFYLGDKKIKKLISEIGEFSLVSFLNDGNYLALSDVVSEPVAKATCEAWNRLKDTTELATFLIEHDFNSLLASKLMRLCKHNTVERLKTNPYSLISLIDLKKRSFDLVEELAQKLNVASDAPRRLAGVIEFILYRALEQGHTMIDMSGISAEINSLKIKKLPDVETCVKAALSMKVACVYQEKDKIFIQSAGAAFIEQSLEKHMANLANIPLQLDLLGVPEEAAEEVVSNYSDALKRWHGYSLTPEQQNAVLMALYSRVSVITGFGGTGKTTIIKTIVEIAEESQRTVYVCALAGKAKERAREAIDRETFTIHALIRELSKKESKFINKYCDPLIIIDEASMVDISLANLLFRAFGKNKFSLLMIGDTAQLAPVGFGVFWHELARSEKMRTTHLTQVHRQAHGSALHNAAMAIRNGNIQTLSVWNGEKEGVYLVNGGEQPLGILPTIVKDTNAKVLTPYQSRNYKSSTHSVNRLLQGSINSNDSGLKIGGSIIKIDDPVIVTKNDYKLSLFNGMTGIVRGINVDEDSQEVICAFEFDGVDETANLTIKQCYEVGIELAYALTVHKSQGSEYEACIVIPEGMERSMLYTALTRPKKLCLILGKQRDYDRASQLPARIETLKYGFRYQ